MGSLSFDSSRDSGSPAIRRAHVAIRAPARRRANTRSSHRARGCARNTLRPNAAAAHPGATNRARISNDPSDRDRTPPRVARNAGCHARRHATTRGRAPLPPRANDCVVPRSVPPALIVMFHRILLFTNGVAQGPAFVGPVDTTGQVSCHGARRAIEFRVRDRCLPRRCETKSTLPGRSFGARPAIRLLLELRARGLRIPLRARGRLLRIAHRW